MGDDVLADMRRFADAMRDRRIPVGPPPVLISRRMRAALEESADPGIRRALEDGRVVCVKE